MSIFVEHIGAKGFLSFGPEWPGLDLRDLNILIGPNGSGKSNLIEAIALFKALPDNPEKFLSRWGQRFSDWVWKGAPARDEARLRLTVAMPEGGFFTRFTGFPASVTHGFGLGKQSVAPERLRLFEELISITGADTPNAKEILAATSLTPPNDMSRSVLSRPRGMHIELLFSIADIYRSIQIFRGPQTIGPESIKQSRNSGPSDVLDDDGTNLGMVLDRISGKAASRQGLLGAIQEVNPSIVDIRLRPAGGSAQELFADEGLSELLPVSRMSEGTIRWLCLLAILLNDQPPPLICLEEPEIGLHPDALIALARLLREASKRTQIIVTTHSPTLVDAFTDTPECVVVCERTPTGSSMRRLEKDKLQHWLADFNMGLGYLWETGRLGGNRW
ncbi:MAG: AAA family ATPase [Acidobacteria bacterium]|nr:AAA family ATPase [Acidobacteriota bacterium]